VILTGASGAGKTAIAKAIRDRRPKVAEVAFFDRIVVPTPEAMIAGWARAQPGSACRLCNGWSASRSSRIS
jgi:hypothetical protein